MNAAVKFQPFVEPLNLRQRLRLARQQNLKPPPKLNLVEWADEHRYLSKESASTPGKWKTSKVEVARGPMMAFSDPRVHTLSLMCCTQLTKTELLLNAIGYHIHQDPAPIIVVQPGITEGEAFSKDRVDTMLRDCAVLRDKVPKKRAQDGGNTVLHKQFPGGHLTIVGANAPSGLAMRPVRIILCDETDKYPASAGDEGDPIKLITRRAATFWNRKIVHCCSPTIENFSRIDTEYKAGDARVFEPPCPHCGHREEMRWSQVKWEPDRPGTARYHCGKCNEPWTERQRKDAIAATRFLPDFGWRATQPFDGHASFRVSKLASPWESMADLAREFLQARKSPHLLKTFVNTILAETWKEGGDRPEWKRLYDRREDYKINSIPPGVLKLYCGVDIQKDYIVYEVVGYGRNMQSWSIDYRTIPGDTSDESSENSPWVPLKKILEEQWVHPGGAVLNLSKIGIDSSYNTQVVRRWVANFPVNRVIAVRGQDDYPLVIGVPKSVQISKTGKKKTRGARQYPVGTNLLKTELYGWLKQDIPEDLEKFDFPTGFCHFPEYPQEYFKGITAESVKPKLVKGYTIYEWHKEYERNEPLDCRNYARAMAELDGLSRYKPAQWSQLAVRLGIVDAPITPVEPLQIPRAAPKVPESDPRPVRRRQSNWLNRGRR